MSFPRLSVIVVVTAVLMPLSLAEAAKSAADAEAVNVVPIRLAVTECGGGPVQKWRHIQPTPMRDKCLAQRLGGSLNGATGGSATGSGPSHGSATAPEGRVPSAEK